MKIINIHQREYHQPYARLCDILETLSSRNDRLWPNEIWPPMILSDGLAVHSRGGHGPIGYYISNYDPGKCIEFTFTQPEDFVGTHTFEILVISESLCILKHTIDMDLNSRGAVVWCCAIKWLHDALLEDCLDKVHNQLEESMIHSPHNFWVKILRWLLKKGKKEVIQWPGLVKLAGGFLLFLAIDEKERIIVMPSDDQSTRQFSEIV